MKHFNTQVTRQNKISPDYYELTFSWNETVPEAGQFFTLNCWEESDPLLRRPFAFSGFSSKKKEASMIYQLRGKGTRRISNLKEGDSLDLLGPLGTPFPAPEGKHPVLIGGGIGTGPMVFLANSLAQKGLEPLLVLGFRSKPFIPELNLHSSVELVISTDDGSSGFQGNVVDYLSQRKNTAEQCYCCGPHPMLKSCHFWALDQNIPCYVSMEEIMACGIGACQGCAVEVTLPQKFVRVCKEGPVFDSRIIKWT